MLFAFEAGKLNKFPGISLAITITIGKGINSSRIRIPIGKPFSRLPYGVYLL